MKVVHPGKPGQAVGCDTVSAERGDRPDEHAQECAFDAPRSTPAGAADHGPGLDGGLGRRRCGAVGTAGLPLAGALSRRRVGGADTCTGSSAPQHRPHQVPAARVAEIERRRRQRLSGPAIARQLAMPVSTVGGILRRLGLGKLSALEPKPPVVRYQRERPGELIHIDTKKLGRIAAVGHRITGDRRDTRRGAGWEAVHVCIDDASRLAYSEVLPDERKATAVPFLERAVAWFARHGVTVERVMTDNGSAYRSHHWRHACGELALRHLRTRPYTPRTNGKAERFIQTSLRGMGLRAAFCDLARTHRGGARPLARPLQHRPATRRPGPATARHPPAPVGVPQFDRGHCSSVPTCH